MHIHAVHRGTDLAECGRKRDRGGRDDLGLQLDRYEFVAMA
jgi:hypothetical protein